MRRNHLFFGIISLLIITSTITNPDKKTHLDLVFNKFILNKDELVKTNGLELMVLPLAKNAFGEILSVDNYVLFSIGRIDYNGIKKNISIGVFGNVFLLINKSEWDNLGKDLKDDNEVSIKTPKKIESKKVESIDNNTKIGDKIYGDFNGDGKFEYAFRVLTKKGYGNPVEDGVPDEYEIHFSDKNIKPITDNFYWFWLINEGDLDNDGSDEISAREDPMNGCTGIVKTFTIKNGKSYYLFEPFSFYSGTCDNDMSIDPKDLVEKDNGIVYYYEYNSNGKYSVNSAGKRINNAEKVKAIRGLTKTTNNAPLNNENISRNVVVDTMAQ